MKGSYVAAARFTVVDTRVWGRCSSFVRGIIFWVVLLLEEMQISVISHDFSSSAECERTTQPYGRNRSRRGRAFDGVLDGTIAKATAAWRCANKTACLSGQFTLGMEVRELGIS